MGRRKAALEPIGGKKEVAFADFKAIMAGLTDTTPTKDIVNAFKVFDKDVRGKKLVACARQPANAPRRERAGRASRWPYPVLGNVAAGRLVRARAL
jgi:hypothetical protein